MTEGGKILIVFGGIAVVLVGVYLLALKLSIFGEMVALYPAKKHGRVAGLKLTYVNGDMSRFWLWVAVTDEGLHCRGLVLGRALVPWDKIENCTHEGGILFDRCRVDVHGLSSFLWVHGRCAERLMAGCDSNSRRAS